MDDEISAIAQIVVRAPPAAVFNAFVNSETMSKFWFHRTDGGLSEGQTVAWFIGTGDDALPVFRDRNGGHCA